MIHARHIIDTKSDDPYIRRLVEYVQGTGYSEVDRPYDYQYYSPNALIWLKELVDNNTDKMNILFMHHFVTNRTGNGVGLPKNGNWFYSDVHPSSELDPKEGNIYPVGSNSLTGIEFYFFKKLLNESFYFSFFIWIRPYGRTYFQFNLRVLFILLLIPDK